MWSLCQGASGRGPLECFSEAGDSDGCSWAVLLFALDSLLLPRKLREESFRDLFKEGQATNRLLKYLN
jgi:hypothetical protein